MNIYESLEVGLKGLISHKLRSFLTMLGIIFGVAAVIAMFSIGEGARRETLAQIELMGTNNIRIKQSKLEGPELGRARQLGLEGLTVDDAKYISSFTHLISTVAPIKEVDLSVRLRGKFIKAHVVGVKPGYMKTSNFYTKKGRFIADSDINECKRVCVLGSDVNKELFPFEDSLGRDVNIAGAWYAVVGIMEDKAKSGSGIFSSLRDINKDIYIPLSTILQRVGGTANLTEIIVQLKNSTEIMAVANLIDSVLKRRHFGISDYELVIPEELLRHSQRTQRIFNIVMGCIAGISLMVGGIGIMNIMLATVFQRTREIGIRRAVGASQRDILIQFLLEALVITITGGLIGIIFGVCFAKLITMYAGWTTAFSFKAIFLAFTISASIGVIFGIYPARKAARLDPIEALRYE
jgi:putative ABC transport system permease protein